MTVRSNGVWAVSRNKHGRLEYEPCEGRRDAEEFIAEVLDGNGVVMTDDELAAALNMSPLNMDDADIRLDIADEEKVYA